MVIDMLCWFPQEHPTLNVIMNICNYRWNIVYYHIAARGWIITGNAIIQLYTIHER